MVAKDDKFKPLLEPQGSLQLSSAGLSVKFVVEEVVERLEYEKQPGGDFFSQDKAGWPP